MNVERTKGHGRYATYSVHSPKLLKNWHVKLRPTQLDSQLENELRHMKWAQQRLMSPEKAYKLMMPGISLLISKTMEGIPSYKCIDVLEPDRIIASLSNAINTIRTVDAESFHFRQPYWTTEEGLETNIKSLANSKNKHQNLHPDFAGLTFQELKNIVDLGPSNQNVALSHGDLCMPNVLLNEDGDISGIVDLGDLHVGDPDLDLAVMSWTVQANMGDKWSNRLLNMHGTNADEHSIVYNRLAYDLHLEHPTNWAWVSDPKLVEQRARLSDENGVIDD